MTPAEMDCCKENGRNCHMGGSNHKFVTQRDHSASPATIVQSSTLHVFFPLSSARSKFNMSFPTRLSRLRQSASYISFAARPFQQFKKLIPSVPSHKRTKVDARPEPRPEESHEALALLVQQSIFGHPDPVFAEDTAA